ncbi:MAG: GNAT family N-acetyltransferase [Alphaproteobacteria bacterium]|nr:MAG: GNAT family N-acetyltransferase [Alphaproteobacteria bacterium]
MKLKGFTLVSNPFVVDAELAIPMAQAAAQDCRAAVVSAMPIPKRFATMCFDRGALRYAARYGDEIIAFRDIAVAISRASYKSDLGWGFPEDESFAREIELDAVAGRVRGYVLMSGRQPAAYVFCRIDHDVIVYKHIGYDERFAQSSPGTVLLYLMLQRLFKEYEFKLLDFDGTEYYAYKEFFSTHAISCARLFWFRPRLPEIALFGAHWALMATWRFASLLRHHIWRGKLG